MSSELINKIRAALSDNTEPFAYTEEELITALEIAAGAYSKYRPAKKRGSITVIPGVSEYSLPEGFQTWTEGLEGYRVSDSTVDLGFKPLREYEIEYLYLADRKPDEIPPAHIPLLVDYVFYFLISAEVKEAGDISALRLGKGLQIQFDNINELSKVAERRLFNFNENMRQCKGGWV